MKGQLSEAEKEIKKLEDERENHNQKYEEAENESADAKKDWQKALQKVKGLQKNLEAAHELVKTTNTKLLKTEKELERIRAEGENILEEAEIGMLHDGLCDRIGEIEEELKNLVRESLTL